MGTSGGERTAPSKNSLSSASEWRGDVGERGRACRAPRRDGGERGTSEEGGEAQVMSEVRGFKMAAVSSSTLFSPTLPVETEDLRTFEDPNSIFSSDLLRDGEVGVVLLPEAFLAREGVATLTGEPLESEDLAPDGGFLDVGDSTVLTGRTPVDFDDITGDDGDLEKLVPLDEAVHATLDTLVTLDVLVDNVVVLKLFLLVSVLGRDEEALIDEDSTLVILAELVVISVRLVVLYELVELRLVSLLVVVWLHFEFLFESFRLPPLVYLKVFGEAGGGASSGPALRDL